LKCLEGKNKRDLQTELFNERLLSDLDGNVKCGNSLIGRDIYESAQGMIFEREEKLRINAFDWKTEFKPIMDQGGFDAVIGNPPYVRQESLGADKTYFKTILRCITASPIFMLILLSRAFHFCAKRIVWLHCRQQMDARQLRRTLAPLVKVSGHP